VVVVVEETEAAGIVGDVVVRGGAGGLVDPHRQRDWTWRIRRDS
jgi:hypothetical protein